jgi:hypothetical protein
MMLAIHLGLAVNMLDCLLLFLCVNTMGVNTNSVIVYKIKLISVFFT